MTRTTLDLDPSILREIRSRSRRDHKSMGQVASEAIARGFAERTEAPAPFRWRSAPMGKPLVDLEDKDAVLRILDGDGP